jgi:hypothetical protein
MQKAIILTEEEYDGLQEELSSYRKQLRTYKNAIKHVYEHNYKNDILVLELDQDVIKSTFGNGAYRDVIIIKK